MQRYGAYKDSGIEWIGEIPEGWETIRSRYCVALRQNGNWGDEPEHPDEGDYCLRAADFDYEHLRFKDEANYVKRCFSKEKFEQVRLREGDIVIEKSGGGEKTPVGRALVFRGGFEACYSNFLERLRVERSRALPVFFFYWWTACYQAGLFVNYFNQTTGIQNLNTSALLSEMEIALPPLPEQQAIADYLDAKTAQIDSIVSQTERSIGLLREYRKSVISEAVTKGLDPDAPMRDSGVEWIGKIPVGWEVKKSKSEMTFINGRAYKQEELLNEGPYRVLRVGNFNTNDSWYYTDLELPEKQYCSKGDLLYLWATTFGPEIWTGEKVVFHYHIWKVETTNSLIKKYAFYALLASSLWQELQSHGSTMVHITKNGMENTFYPFPPLPEQQAIADYLDAKTAEIDSLINAKQRQVELLKEYRKSLISEAVTGKFKVPGLE